MNDRAADDSLVLRPDDGQLFVIRILNSGEERVTRYCCRALSGHELRFPMFYDPEQPGDRTRRARVGLDAIPVRRLSYLSPTPLPRR